MVITTDVDIKKLKVRLPFQLRYHPNFSSARVTVDEDQIHFHLTDQNNGLPEIWIFDSSRKSWANVTFEVDHANLST
jgi:hypothetical protein